MDKVIVYQNNEGGLSIIVPSKGVDLSIEEIARKDVPANVAYKIIDASEIPSDRTFRNAWEYDFAEPHGYGIGSEAWFAQQENNQ